ncbi:MAG: hypothetical protein A2144_08130 [Chloroflexi bacterium RBG_16_50_9]|nr:MAG: hypothetical protein A2144_08130 [Chloroflexi bacterium RBG_16_50_9]
MFVLGWLAGHAFVEYIADYAPWVAFALLVLVGSRMIWESFHEKESGENLDITRGILLLTLSIATSIDSLAVGLSFAFLKVNIVLAAATVSTVTFIVTITGFIVGNRMGALMGKRAEAIGGAILIVIGLRILLEHIL